MFPSVLINLCYGMFFLSPPNHPVLALAEGGSTFPSSNNFDWIRHCPLRKKRVGLS